MYVCTVFYHHVPFLQYSPNCHLTTEVNKEIPCNFSVIVLQY